MRSPCIVAGCFLEEDGFLSWRNGDEPVRRAGLVAKRVAEMPAAGLVMHEVPSTRMPRARAVITSGTVDMPTTSAPIRSSMRISAGVSKLGPSTAAYTPSWSVMPPAAATPRAT